MGHRLFFAQIGTGIRRFEQQCVICRRHRADYIFDNIVIYEVEDIPTIEGEGAGGIDVAGCYLCGRQALAQAVAKRWTTVDEEFDYKDKQGVAVRTIYEIKKMLFGSGSGDTDDLKDHGVFTGFFASVADS